MQAVQEGFLYFALFCGLYFQVFLLVSYFLWNGKTEFGEDDTPALVPYEPVVAVMVHCFNEETTVAGTVHSLLNMDYPREKLRILVIDDGSTDGTWNAVQEFVNNPSVVLLQKKNEGSKFAALNFGLEKIKSDIHADIIGCLDADSSVDPQALRESLKEFTKPGVMAVVPSMVIDHPHTFFQYMQKVEYEIGTYVKQAFSRLNMLYIAPGPFTMFRREVFEQLGGYHEAHHTEDMEIALRMQMANMRLSHAVHSLVYTKGPRTWPVLLKQRVRWTYGFLMNTWDYRKNFFKSNLGHVGVTLPILLVLFAISIIIIPFTLIGIALPIINFSKRIFATHQVFTPMHFDWFYVNTSAIVILSFVTLGTMAVALVIGRRKLLGQKLLSLDLLTLAVYSFFAAWWSGKSAYNAIRRKKHSWR